MYVWVCVSGLEYATHNEFCAADRRTRVTGEVVHPTGSYEVEEAEHSTQLKLHYKRGEEVSEGTTQVFMGIQASHIKIRCLSDTEIFTLRWMAASTAF